MLLFSLYFNPSIIKLLMLSMSDVKSFISDIGIITSLQYVKTRKIIKLRFWITMSSSHLYTSSLERGPTTSICQIKMYVCMYICRYVYMYVCVYIQVNSILYFLFLQSLIHDIFDELIFILNIRQFLYLSIIF